MRVQRLAIFVVLLMLTASMQAQKTFSILPEQPKPGQTIKISYNPSGTVLFGLDNISAIAYLMANKNLPTAYDVKLSKDGNNYFGEVPTNDSTSAVFVLFTAGNKSDNNNDEGYYTLMYGSDGKPVQGAALSAGYGMGNYSGITGLKRDMEKQTKYVKQEYRDFPGSKEKYRNEYLVSLAQSKEDADKEELKKELGVIAANPNATEQELLMAKAQYESAFKDKVKGAELDKLVKQRYPNGNWVKGEMMTAFYNEPDGKKKDSLLQVMMQKYPPATPRDESNYGFMASQLVTYYGNKGDYKKMWEAADAVKDKAALASAFNSIAWKMAGEGIHGKPGDIKMGKEISGKSLDLVKQDMAQNMQQKPSYYTEKQWKEQQESNYYMYADTYATLLYHNKEYAKAFELEKNAVETFKRNDVSMNETYSALLEKTKGAKAALQELETFVKAGKASEKMKEQFKRLYLADKHTEAQWTSYMANIEKEQLAKVREELVKKMLNDPAPLFKLKDIGGNEISLASLKGKTVVVDFWATWCGPCVASFPGMQKAVNKYKDDPNVVFLFIDTWESGDNREKLVKDFIAKNKYSFNVLYDQTKKDSDEFEVVGNYKVDGIPTKFVIDKNNNIRFTNVGYNGSADALVAELSMMIDMVNAEAKTGTSTPKKGF